MTILLRRFRAPLVGVAAIVLATGTALAAGPTAPGAAGLTNAENHAAKNLPARAADGATGGQAEPGDREDSANTANATSGDTGDPASGDTGSADHCSVDLTQAPAVLAGLNHGSVVCTAARGTPPGGYSSKTFANHGAWVSSFAKADHGSNQSATGQSHRPSH